MRVFLGIKSNIKTDFYKDGVHDERAEERRVTHTCTHVHTTTNNIKDLVISRYFTMNI